jgi:hypothetical protein
LPVRGWEAGIEGAGGERNLKESLTHESQESRSFLKKRTKKLLSVWCSGAPTVVRDSNGQKFFGAFFQKRTAFFN